MLSTYTVTKSNYGALKLRIAGKNFYNYWFTE